MEKYIDLKNRIMTAVKDERYADAEYLSQHYKDIIRKDHNIKHIEQLEMEIFAVYSHWLINTQDEDSVASDQVKELLKDFI